MITRVRVFAIIVGIPIAADSVSQAPHVSNRESTLTVLTLTITDQDAAQAARVGHVRGVVVDATGGGLRWAFVRVLQPASKSLIARVPADPNGVFQTGALQPGSYVLVAWAQGFGVRRLSPVVVRAGETTDVGTMQLDLASCDAPGMMCDDFGMGPPDPFLARGYLELKLDCGVELRNNKCYCPDSSGAMRQDRALDLRLTKDETGVYLNAVNGATLSASRESRFRLDGLGPGDEIWVRTHEGLRSHVFFVDDVERGSPSVRFWHVTRQR